MALRFQKDLSSFEFHYDPPTSNEVNLLNSFISIYANLRSNLSEFDKKYYTIVPNVITTSSRYEVEEKLKELKFASGQMVAYLEGKLENLPEKVKQIEKQLTEMEKENKVLFDSLNKFIQAEDFKVEPEKLRAFPNEYESFLLEALGTYKNGFYIACCSMCGNILAGLVKDACQRNNLKYKGLAEGIKDLKDPGVIKEPYKQLIDVAKYYRDHADHPTSEAFTKEKSKLFLSSRNIKRIF